MIKSRLSKYGKFEYIATLDDDTNYIEICGVCDSAVDSCTKAAAKLRKLADVFEALSLESKPANSLIQDQLNEEILGEKEDPENDEEFTMETALA